MTDDEKRLDASQRLDASLAVVTLFRVAKALAGFEPKHSMPMETICEIATNAAHAANRERERLYAENRELHLRLDEARLAVRGAKTCGVFVLGADGKYHLATDHLTTEGKTT